MVPTHKVVLKENLRVESTNALTKAINEVFSRLVTQESTSFLKSLRRPLNVVPGQSTMKLFAKNDLVDDFNRAEIEKMPGELYQSPAEDGGPDLQLL